MTANAAAIGTVEELEAAAACIRADTAAPRANFRGVTSDKVGASTSSDNVPVTTVCALPAVGRELEDAHYKPGGISWANKTDGFRRHPVAPPARGGKACGWMTKKRHHGSTKMLRHADALVEFANCLHAPDGTPPRTSGALRSFTNGRSPREIANSLWGLRVLQPSTHKAHAQTMYSQGTPWLTELPTQSSRLVSLMRPFTVPKKKSKLSWRRSRAHREPIPSALQPEFVEAPASPSSVEMDRVCGKSFIVNKICPHACSLAESCRKLTLEDGIQAKRRQALVPQMSNSSIRTKSILVPIGRQPREPGAEHRKGYGLTKNSWSIAVANTLAAKYQIGAGVICELWSLFSKYADDALCASDEELILTLDRFHLMVLHLIRGNFTEARDIPRSLFAINPTHESETVSFVEFLEWYLMHSFDEFMVLPGYQRMLRDLARKHNIQYLDAERIFDEFNRYDLDHSGSISFNEFRSILRSLLQIGPATDFSQSRLEALWTDLNTDGSEDASLEEFFVWYVKHFIGAEQGISPIEHFYQSMRMPLGRVSEGY
eukprot:GEMP01014046.1.p1 GENE.GEMP01014046.1~~GEMP01014046.1.p1  ORF type:complete len:545 (+),score=83.44 GEMP01014046.1:147-1781(+)